MLPIVQSRTPSVYDILGLNIMKNCADNWDSTMFKPMVAIFMEYLKADMVGHDNNPSSWEADMGNRRFEVSLCCIYMNIYMKEKLLNDMTSLLCLSVKSFSILRF